MTTFEGALFTLGKPSVKSPVGCSGNRILLKPTAIDNLLAMIVYCPIISKHRTNQNYIDVATESVIGKVEKAWLTLDQFMISGSLENNWYTKEQHLWLHYNDTTNNYPLGFSFEINQVHVDNINPWLTGIYLVSRIEKITALYLGPQDTIAHGKDSTFKYNDPILNQIAAQMEKTNEQSAGK